MASSGSMSKGVFLTYQLTRHTNKTKRLQAIVSGTVGITNNLSICDVKWIPKRRVDVTRI